MSKSLIVKGLFAIAAVTGVMASVPASAHPFDHARWRDDRGWEQRGYGPAYYDAYRGERYYHHDRDFRRYWHDRHDRYDRYDGYDRHDGYDRGYHDQWRR